MKPSIGRIVHVAYPGGTCMAAIVTAVHDDHDVDLTIFPPASLPEAISVPAPATNAVFDDDDLPSERKAGSWHWPEMVPREPGDRPPQH